MTDSILRRWEAESGFEIRGEYTPADIGGSYAKALGAPGEFPYTRHIRPEGYRAAPWMPSLYAGFGEPQDANARFLYLIGQGNGRVSVAFDLPTQLGLDSDHAAARHEVGRVGVAIDSLRDFERLLDGIPIETIPVTMNMNALAPVMIAMLASVARRRGVPLDRLRGTISNDIYHEVACRGLAVWELPASSRLLADTAEFIIREMPRYFAFNIRAVLLHEVAATPAEELGIGLCIARRYIQLLTDRGLPPERIARRLSLFFSSGTRFLEDVAKFRAARRMWAYMLRDEFGVTDPEALKLRMTATACNGTHFTRQQPELNIVRSALGVLACALGGVQTMVGTALDEAYEIPSEHAQQVALRVQQIVALETDVCATADPLGGSYFIESATDQIEQLASGVMAQIEQWGGIDSALQQSRIQGLLRDHSFDVQEAIESGARPIVGVNVHTEDATTAPLQLWQQDPHVGERRVAELADLRSTRDSALVTRRLSELRAAAGGVGSVMPALVEAVEAYATVGEISQSLSEAFGSNMLHMVS